ncbi:MAG TPA: hypothetical protein VEY67_12475 [Candidatus Dormibacteraeota bacterium]|nr:hypothetical protein [Candidatus Dormibacteraeota bacterium]
MATSGARTTRLAAAVRWLRGSRRALWTGTGALLAVVFAGPFLLLAAAVALVAILLEQRVRRGGPADLAGWVRHLAEMVLAMYVGMLAYHALAQPALAALVGRGPFEGDLGYAWMVASMVLPMAALMLRQGHGTRMTAEMSFAMVAPTVLCFALVRFSIAPVVPLLAWLTPTSVYGAAHVAMIVGMVAAMYLRRAMYGCGTESPSAGSVVSAPLRVASGA